MVLFLLLDSAQNSMIEATQAYGIEEASETESEAQVNQLSKHFLLHITQQIPIIRKQQQSHKISRFMFPNPNTVLYRKIWNYVSSKP